MIATNEIKTALAVIGFEAEDVHPADDPSYTVFKNADGFFFEACLGKELKALSINDVMNQITNCMNGEKE